VHSSLGISTAIQTLHVQPHTQVLRTDSAGRERQLRRTDDDVHAQAFALLDGGVLEGKLEMLVSR